MKKTNAIMFLNLRKKEKDISYDPTNKYEILGAFDLPDCGEWHIEKTTGINEFVWRNQIEIE